MDAVFPEKVTVTTHQQYHTTDALSPTTVAQSPLEQFRQWFADASEDDVVKEPEAMSLSTATLSGIPSARIVLFKQLDTRGFIFFTNYTSRKSQEILKNPRAALVFYWREIHRSVRVLGKVEKISQEESEEYYRSRPVGSQLGAWASKQSTVVGEGEVHERFEKLQNRFGVNKDDKEGDVPLPDFWGGWRVVPEYVNKSQYSSFSPLIFLIIVKSSFGLVNRLVCMTGFAIFLPRVLLLMHPSGGSNVWRLSC